MFQQTPQKRVLFPRGLKQVRSGGFVVFGLLLVFVTALLTSIFAPSRPALAATNNTLSFQARLMTNTGAIVQDGTYNVQFKLYTGGTAGGPAGVGQANAGTNLWTETWYDSNGATTGNDARVTVRNGYLSVNLGSQTAFPANLNWDQELWISLNIGGTSQTTTPTWDGEMNPRLKLTGTPYAFRAGQLATAHTSNGFGSTLSILQPTGGNQTFQIADQTAAGTYTLCVQNSTACGFALASGNNNYIQNQNVSQQATSNFWISGTGRADTSLQAPALDTATATTLTIGSTNATAINFNTGGTLEWSILSTGEFQGNGASVVRSSTGNITVASNGGNGNVILTPNGTGYTSVSAGGLRMSTTEVITSGRVLQNVTANTSILTAGTLGLDRGGTGIATTPTNGQLLIGNGTNYSLSTLGSTGGITITNTAGGISVGTDATICKTSGNCAGAGNGITGTGTTNSIAVFTASGTIGNSILSQNGTTIDVSGNIQGTTANFNALQTNGVTRIDASGNLTNIANITLNGGVNARGYFTSNTANTNNGQWTKLATCTLVGQYQDCRSQATVVSTGDGGSIDRATVDIRVKQQNVMGGVPYIAVHVYDTQDFAPTHFSAVTTVNTTGSTVVELWGRIDDMYQTWNINPLINTGTVQFNWLSTQGFSASLPVGTVTASVYGPQTVSTLTATGDIATSGNMNVNGQTVITSGRVLQNVTASAGILTSGTVASGLLSGSYTGITGVGTITTGTWNGAVITDTYVADNLTVSSAGNVAWAALSGFPAGCTSGQAVTAVGTTLTCSTFATTDTNTTYTNGTDLTLVGNTFGLESQIDSVSTLSRASSNLTLQTTTSGNIILNSAGTVNITGSTNVTGNVTISGELQTGSMRTLKATYGVGESNQWKRIATVPATDGLVQIEGTIGGQDFFTAGQGHVWVDLGLSYRNGYLVHGTSKGHMASDSGARANLIMVTNGTTLEIYIEKTAYTQYAFSLRASGSATLLDDSWTSTDPRGRAGWTTQQEISDHLLLVGNNLITYNGAALPSLTMYGGNLGVSNDLIFSGTTVITAARVLQNVTANANILTSGTIATGLLSGSYTGITGVGALTAGSIGSGFGTISTGNNITTTAAVQGGTVTGTTSITTPTLQNAGTLNVSATGANQINFNTNGTLEWSILSTGELQGNGASVVRSSTGNITIASNGGNGNVVLTPNGTGYTSVSAGGFRMSTTEVITSGRVLQNVTASAGILTSGTVASGLLTGGYTGITAVGTLTSLTASGAITSTVTTGTAPLVVASTTKVANLNVDLLDGLDSTAFAASSGSANYIQNQNFVQQAASFNISGSGYIGNTGVYAFSVANGSNAGFMNVNTTGSGILQVTPYSSGGGVQVLGGTAQSPEYSLFASTNGTTANNTHSRWSMLGNWVFFGGMGTTNRLFFDVGGTAQASLDNAGNFKDRTSSSQGTPDVAEYIPAAPDVAVADVVMADPDNTERVVKANGAYSGAALGVISDGTSGIQINPYETLDGTKTRTDVMPLVLAGRVPVKVTNEGGAIRPGDNLTVSSTTGHAMKATRAGATIGKSLGFFDGTTGTVLALINASYYDPNDGDNIQASSGSFESLMADAGTFNSFNVSGDASLQNLTVAGSAVVQGNLAVQGKTTVTDIQINGRIVVGGNKPVIAVGTALGAPTVTNGVPVDSTKPAVDVDGNDTAGTITAKTGATNTANGVLATITFAKKYDTSYKVVVSASNNMASKLNVYVVKSADGFILMTDDTVDISQEYHFDYITIGTATAAAN